MDILFISLIDFDSISEHGLYNDLLREFVNHNHKITIISPVEKRTGRITETFSRNGVQFIKVRIGNIQKTNYIEKGVSTLLLANQILNAFTRYCEKEHFDLILYATPPITIYKTIKRIKKVTKATTCLMLKDIWPQEMVDLGLINRKGILYNFFKNEERRMYLISDWIGYTSNASKNYLLAESVPENKLIPINNSVDASYVHNFSNTDSEFLKKYDIDLEKILFFYGGNLGKPQDVDYLLECLKTQMDKKDRLFLLCGGGTEYKKIECFFQEYSPSNMKLLPYLPKNEYDQLLLLCDVGLVFLNHRFSVPNCPSRFYTYMEYAKPVLACTDSVTDIKKDIYDGNFGWWCESNSVNSFELLVEEVCKLGKDNLSKLGSNARKYLENNYTVDKEYRTIIGSVNK